MRAVPSVLIVRSGGGSRRGSSTTEASWPGPSDSSEKAVLTALPASEARFDHAAALGTVALLTGTGCLLEPGQATPVAGVFPIPHACGCQRPRAHLMG